MSTQPKLHPLGVLAVLQGAVYDLAHRMPDYLEPSPTKLASVAKCIGLNISVEQGAVSIGNPANDVYAWMDGRDFDRSMLDRTFKELVAKVRNGEAEAEVPLDIELRRLDGGSVGVASFAMRCDYPVAPDKLDDNLSQLCREWADMNLAEGEAAIIKIVREISDPDAVLTPPACTQCPHAGQPVKKSGMTL